MIAKFYQNPYFDEVFGLLQPDFPIPTKQSRNKEQVAEFKKRVTSMLQSKISPRWPHKGRLLVLVTISCTAQQIKKVDIDNFLKILFDLFTGYVYEDDSQVFYVMADKHIHPANMIGFMAGVRELREDEFAESWSSLYSSNPEHWKEERALKFGREIN